MTALVTVATPLALVDGLDVALAPALELGALAIAAVVLAHRAGDARGGELRSAALAVAALTMLHLASTELVTAAATREQGQALLSGLWALTGVAVLLAGLLRDQPALRRAALALLLTTVGKVAVYDLASLTSIYRVASLVALGGLLLCGAFAWQRVRPRPPADLRAMPQALR
jgi:uncharacterized membrane protein